MKEIDGWIKIKKYTDDDGKPVCGECFIPYPCGFYKDVPITKGTVPNEPGPLCPVWHGESKGEWQPIAHLLALMAALEIPHPEWWLAKPPEFLAECGRAITAQAKLVNTPPQENNHE